MQKLKTLKSQITSKMDKHKKIIAGITIAVAIIGAFVNLGLAINGFIKLTNNMDLLQEIQSNWNTYTILDMQVAATCPTGYVNAVTDRKWAGTKDGCYCGSVSSNTLKSNNITCGPLCSGTCSDKMNSVGCSKFTGKGSQPYSYISSVTGTTSQLCLKRSSESFATAGPLVDGGSCPSGYNKCGTKADFVFCTKESQCPITKWDFSQVLSSSLGTACPAGSCVVLSDDGTNANILAFKRSDTFDALPISQVTLNEYSMCEKEATDNLTPGRKTFYYYQGTIGTCYTAGANFWNPDTYNVNEADLFTYNGLSSYITNLNNYPDPSKSMSGYYESGKSGTDFTYKLFNRNFIPFAASCRDKQAQLLKDIDSALNVKKAQTVLLIFAVLTAAIVGIVISALEMANLLGYDLPWFQGKGEEEKEKITRIKKIISWGSKGLCIPFQIWAIVVCSAIKTFFKQLSSGACSTDYVNSTMEFLSNTFNSTFNSNIAGIVIVIGTLIYEVVMYFQDKKKKAQVADSPAGDNSNLVGDTTRKSDPSSTQQSPVDIAVSDETAKTVVPKTVATEAAPTQAANNQSNIVVEVQTPFQPHEVDEPNPQ